MVQTTTSTSLSESTNLQFKELLHSPNSGLSDKARELVDQSLLPTISMLGQSMVSDWEHSTTRLLLLRDTRAVEMLQSLFTRQYEVKAKDGRWKNRFRFEYSHQVHYEFLVDIVFEYCSRSKMNFILKWFQYWSIKTLVCSLRLLFGCEIMNSIQTLDCLCLLLHHNQHGSQSYIRSNYNVSNRTLSSDLRVLLGEQICSTRRMDQKECPFEIKLAQLFWLSHHTNPFRTPEM